MYTCTAVPLTYCTSDVRAGTAVPLAQWPDASHQEEHRDHVELKGVGGEGGRLLMPLSESAPPLPHVFIALVLRHHHALLSRLSSTQIFFIALTNSYCAIIMPFAGWFGPLAMPIYVLCASVRARWGGTEGGREGRGEGGWFGLLAHHAGLRPR